MCDAPHIRVFDTRRSIIRPWGNDYNLPYMGDSSTFRIHSKALKRLNVDTLRQRMHHLVRPEFDLFYKIYEDTSILMQMPLTTREDFNNMKDADLFDKDIMDLIGHFNIEETDPDFTPTNRFVTVFTTLELAKERRRMIVWTKIINELFALAHSFSLPSVEEVCRQVHRGQFCVTLDFTCYYWQFALQDAIRQFYCFRYKGHVFRMTAMPMGQRHSAGVGHMATVGLIAKANSFADAYIDNVRFVDDNTTKLAHTVWSFFADCQAIGITINELQQPDQVLGLIRSSGEYLGIHFDYLAKTVKLAEKSITKLKAALVEIRDPEVSTDKCRQILSLLLWASQVLHLDLAPRYHIFKFVRRRLSTSADTQRPAKIWPSIIQDWISWLTTCIHNAPFTPIHPDATDPNGRDFTMFTDASLTGWGAIIIDHRSCTISIAGERWSDEVLSHSPSINVLEMYALQRACIRFQETLSNATVRIYVDNTSTLHLASSRSTSSGYALNTAASVLRQTLQRLNIITTDILYIASNSNPADAPSRDRPVDLNLLVQYMER